MEHLFSQSDLEAIAEALGDTSDSQPHQKWGISSRHSVDVERLRPKSTERSLTDTVEAECRADSIFFIDFSANPLAI